MQVTSIHIKQAKRQAKQLESTYPTLKPGQRLDKAATQYLGVRDYHEAQCLYDRWVMLHVHPSEYADRVSKCATVSSLLLQTSRRIFTHIANP
jgi:hypothetical protein